MFTLNPCENKGKKVNISRDSVNPRRFISEIKEYNLPIENRGNKIRLDFNENNFGCSTAVIQALQKITAQELACYPEYLPLYEELSRYLKILPSNILLTNGTDEAIKLILETYLNPEDEIIVPFPTFSMFEVYASFYGSKFVKIYYNSDLSFPTKKILDQIKNQTKIVVLVNPNNPTGTNIAPNDVEAIVQCAYWNDAIVLLDEAYSQFVGINSINLINKYSNIFILQTFSKAFGLAGLRLGYIVSKSNNIQLLRKMSSPYSVNQIAVIAGIAALKDADYMKNILFQIESNKKYLISCFTQMGYQVFPSSTNFILVNFGEKCNFINNQLLSAGILVRNQSNFILLENCIRITVGTKYQCDLLLKEVKFLGEQWDFFKSCGYSIPSDLIQLRKINGAWR